VNGESWRRWAAGRCPCCAGGIDEWEDSRGEVTGPEVIAEGVSVCGRCIANGHMNPEGFLEALLEAIARRTDQPIDDLLPGSWITCRALRA
jgi:hypothetical protein